MAEGHRCPSGEPLPGVVHHRLRDRVRADREDLRDRPADPGGEVRDDERPGADERRVVLGAGVVGLDDEPLEVVEVGLQADRPRPRDHLAGGRRGQRAVGEDAPEPRVVGGGRQGPDQGSLVRDDRLDEAEGPGEPQGAGRHPAGDERDPDAAIHRGADGGQGSRTDDQVVADERAVDVERDEPDREGGLRAVRGGRIGPAACPAGVSAHRRPRRRARPGGRAAGRRDPARPSPASRERLRDGGRRRLALVGADLEQRDAVRGQRGRQALEQRPDDVEAVRPAVERERAARRTRRSAGPRSRPCGRTAGSRGSGRTARRCPAGPPAADRPRRSACRRRRRGRRRSRGRGRGRPAETSVARIVTLRPIVTRRLRRATASATAIAPLPVPTSATRIGSPPRPGPAPASPGRSASRRMTSPIAASTRASVSGRGISARAIDREREPVELLDPADVGDRLAGRPAGDGRLEPGRRVRPDRRVAGGPRSWSGRRRPPSRAAARRRAGRSRSRTRAAGRSRPSGSRRSSPCPSFPPLARPVRRGPTVRSRRLRGGS